MNLKEFIYPINKRIEKLKYKFGVDKRLTVLRFFCNDCDHKKYIGSQFEIPDFRNSQREFSPGHIAYYMHSQRSAELLGLDYELYKNKLIQDFNAYVRDHTYTGYESIYFHNTENLLQAFEWVESVVIFDTIKELSK